MNPWDNVIYLVRSGSHAYGTNTPESDLDTRGVCIPPAPYLVGLSTFEQRVEESGNDSTIFTLHKFFNLALDCNPNIIELLFVRDIDVLWTTSEGQALRANRDLFLSKHAFNTFGGYAYAQLRKIQNSTKTARHGTHAAYVEKYGYDTKAAAHLVRLYRSGVELLREGTLHVYRQDRDELLDIRNGVRSLAQIEQEAERLNQELQAARDVTLLPNKPDYARAEKLLMELVRPTLEDYYANPENS